MQVAKLVRPDISNQRRHDSRVRKVVLRNTYVLTVKEIDRTDPTAAASKLSRQATYPGEYVRHGPAEGTPTSYRLGVSVGCLCWKTWIT